jgi:predicted glycosyltransferase
MKFLFYFAHPAQYLAMRETICRLLAKQTHQVIILIKTKDVLEELIHHDGLSYTNVLPKERGKSTVSIILSLLRRIVVMFPIIWRTKPDLLISTDASLAQLGRLLRINRVTIVEDDYSVIAKLAALTYPFTQTILCPEVCDVGNWQSKKVGYRGYMKLGYLHPTVFTPDNTVPMHYGLSKRYLLVRLSKLSAHHDNGMSGIDEPLLDAIIQEVTVCRDYQLWITAEGYLAPKYLSYRLLIHPADIHHVLACAIMLISDSQSMSVEAAVLGTPSIRYSDFTGKIAVLSELENRYQLTFGIPAQDREKLLTTLSWLLDTENLHDLFQERRQQMLKDKIDVTSFYVWFFENYPASKHVVEKEETFSVQ